MKKSTLITVLAWLYIILFGYRIAVSVAQMVLYSSLMYANGGSFSEIHFPYSIMGFQFNPVIGFVLILLFNILVLISAVLLLKRKNIGRYILIICNTLISLFMVVSYVVGQLELGLLSDFPDESEFVTRMNIMFLAYMVIGVSVFTLLTILINKKKDEFITPLESE